MRTNDGGSSAGAESRQGSDPGVVHPFGRVVISRDERDESPLGAGLANVDALEDAEAGGNAYQ